MRKLFLSICLFFIAVFAVACAPQTEESDSTPTLPEVYTVTFVQEGQADVVKTVKEGETLQVPEIKATAPVGYSYEWERTDFSTLSEDITVHLKAVPNTYTIYYEVGDDSYASITSDTQSVVYDSTYSPLIPTRFGYTFAGWVVKDTDEVFDPETYTEAGDTYLMAKWTIDIDSDRWFTPDF